MTTVRTVYQDIELTAGTCIGRIVWTDCLASDGPVYAQEIMDKGAAGPNYTALIATGHVEVFPFRFLDSIHIEPAYYGKKLGKKRLTYFIAETKREGFKRIYLRTSYGGKDWERTRLWMEGYYESHGFTGFRHDEVIRDLMLLNL